MTGPQHYAEAQSLLNQARRHGYEDLGVLAAAQVHATLAQAAAVIDQTHDLAPADVGLNANDWTPVLTDTGSN